jgi:hypothetical protein
MDGSIASMPLRECSRRGVTCVLVATATLLTVAYVGLLSPTAAWSDTATPKPTPSRLRTPSAATQTPTTAPDSPLPGNDDQNSAWPIALGGALAGAIITVALERIRDAYLERRAVNTMLQAVKLEVNKLTLDSQSRSQVQPAGGINFRPPLSTLAWSTLMSSGLSWRVASNSKLYSELASFYARVDEANHCSQLAVSLFDLSQQADMDPVLRRGYYERALGLTIEPFVDLEENGRDAEAAIERAVSRR